MSVLLTAGKSSVRKLRKSDKHDKKNCCCESKSVISYLPSEDTAVWNCVLDGETFSIAMRKDTLDIWCNDNFVEAEEEAYDEETTMTFQLQEHKGYILISEGQDGPTFSLTLNGKEVPQTLPGAEHRDSIGGHGTGGKDTFSAV